MESFSDFEYRPISFTIELHVAGVGLTRTYWSFKNPKTCHQDDSQVTNLALDDLHEAGQVCGRSFQRAAFEPLEMVISWYFMGFMNSIKGIGGRIQIKQSGTKL